MLRKEDKPMKTLMKNNGNLFTAGPSLADEFFGRDWPGSSLANWKTATSSPAVNIQETNDDFKIEVAAPGMKRDDFKVELDNNVLTISAQQENKEGENTQKYTRREFSYQSFQRSFSLPDNQVEAENVSARYVDGILYITVPKREEAKVKPARQITIG